MLPFLWTAKGKIITATVIEGFIQKEYPLIEYPKIIKDQPTLTKNILGVHDNI